MRDMLRIRQVLFFLAFLCAASAAIGQLPRDYKPGTICATPQFWCIAAYPGPPGTRCACPAKNGQWVQGKLV
jgi:hypothetical protein